MEGGMGGGMVIVLDIEKEAAPDLFKGMEIPHVKGGHPLVLHGAGPALDLGLAGWGIRLAVVEGGPNPCDKQLHLPVAVRFPVVKAEDLRAPTLCDGRFHDRHQVDEVILAKDVDAHNKAAGLINQRDDMETVFFTVRVRELGSEAGIAAPDLIDMGRS